MKRYMIILVLCLVAPALLYSATASSLPFSNSFLQRSSGIEAVYWNPANIRRIPKQNELMFIPIAITLENNVVSPNLMSGQFLDSSMTREILDKVNDKFVLGVNLNKITFGYATRGWVLSSATNVVARGNIDKHYLEVLLSGNVYGEDYVFHIENNNFGVIAYQDLTFGYGGYPLNSLFPELMKELPIIYVGGSVSLLAGIASAEIFRSHGLFSASDDGMVLYKDIAFRHGSVGTGFKMSLGFSSEVYEIGENHNVSVGLALNNIFGRISWSNDLEEVHYIIETEEEDVRQLDKDFFTEHQENYSIDSFVSRLPFNLRMGTLYRYNDFSFSLDYSQNFGSNYAYFYSPEVSMGMEYAINGWLPVQFGMRLPGRNLLMAYSLGIGLRFDRFECGLGYKSIGSFFGDNAKGMALSTQMKFRF